SFFFFQAEDGIRDFHVTGVQTCALPILVAAARGLISNRPWTPLARQMALAGGMVLVVAYISAAANGVGLLEPGLTWLLLMEPFQIGRASCRERESIGEGDGRRSHGRAAR